MYCQNCGSEIDMSAKICPYCGRMVNISEVIQQKDTKIQEMEQKVSELEQLVKERSKSTNKTIKENFFQPWIFIFPIVFLVLFFTFFIILVSVR
ncbi:MAG: zinc-ribbon domain-containing protein [Promethearchaeota archaeon]